MVRGRALRCPCWWPTAGEHAEAGNTTTARRGVGPCVSSVGVCVLRRGDVRASCGVPCRAWAGGHPLAERPHPRPQERSHGFSLAARDAPSNNETAPWGCCGRGVIESLTSGPASCAVSQPEVGQAGADWIGWRPGRSRRTGSAVLATAEAGQVTGVLLASCSIPFGTRRRPGGFHYGGGLTGRNGESATGASRVTAPFCGEAL